jgi:hypothetical protein
MLDFSSGFHSSAARVVGYAGRRTLHQFSRHRAEAGDARDFLSRLGKSSLPIGQKLEAVMNSLMLMIEGYDED